MEPTTRRIALPASDTLGMKGTLSEHFGRCHSWVLAEVDHGGLKEARILANPLAGAHDCAQLAELLAEMEVDEVVAGGMGRRAQAALEKRGMSVRTGFHGSVEDCLRLYLAGAQPPPSSCGGHGH